MTSNVFTSTKLLLDIIRKPKMAESNQKNVKWGVNYKVMKDKPFEMVFKYTYCHIEDYLDLRKIYTK